MPLGATCLRSGHLQEAHEAAQHAVDLSTGADALQARAYVLMTAVERWSQDPAAAADAAHRAVEAARAANQPLDMAQAQMILGYVLLLDDPAAALVVLDDATRLALAHLPASTSVAGYALSLSARAHARLGDGADAAANLEQALALASEFGSREEYGTVFGSVGVALLLLEHSEAAATVLAAAEQVYGPTFLYMGMGVARDVIIARLIEALGVDAFDAARAHGEAMTEAEARAYALDALSHLSAPVLAPPVTEP
jgi:hypothetical protein